ncbi:unnamed protein product [Ectocarpus fasciculatus]
MPCIRSSCFALGGLLFSSFCSQGYGQVELPALPYGESDLEPYITAETVGFHYGKHHQGYVNNMNAFIEADPDLEGLSLWKLMKQTEGTIFNNAAQIYNHNLYWNSLSPSGGGMPTGDLYTAIESAFGSYEDFQTAFTDLASGHFGSGWAWLMMHEDGSVDVRKQQKRVVFPRRSVRNVGGAREVLAVSVTRRPWIPAPGLRCLGARLLPRLPELEGLLHRGVTFRSPRCRALRFTPV